MLARYNELLDMPMLLESHFAHAQASHLHSLECCQAKISCSTRQIRCSLARTQRLVEGIVLCVLSVDHKVLDLQRTLYNRFELGHGTLDG
jgi:hypothetical protein